MPVGGEDQRPLELIPVGENGGDGPPPSGEGHAIAATSLAVAPGLTPMTMGGDRSSGRCAFCDRPTDAEPFTPRPSMLTYRDPTTQQTRRVQLPRTVVLCDGCMRQRALLAGCPRCRRYGRYPPYAHSPYGSFCTECGGHLYLLSGEDPVR